MIQTNTTYNYGTTATTGEASGSRASMDVSQLGKDDFLKLLLAQLKNQNPLNPADGIEFITQLTQFTQLEQSLGMRQELETIRKALTDGTTASGAGVAGGTEAP